MRASEPPAIPRAKGHWLLGSAKDFAGAPHVFVADLARENGGLAQFRVLHKRFLATSSPEIAHHVFVSRRERWKRGYYNRKLAAVIGQGLLATEGNLWRRRHDIVQPPLRRNEAARLVPIIQRAATKMLDGWETKRRQNETVAVGKEAQRLALDVIAQRILSVGLDPAATDRFGEDMRETLLLLRQRNTSIRRPGCGVAPDAPAGLPGIATIWTDLRPPYRRSRSQWPAGGSRCADRADGRAGSSNEKNSAAPSADRRN